MLRSSFFFLLSSFPVPSPGRSVTRARRLYVSRIANFRVSDPRYGAAHKDVRCRHSAKDGAYGGYPVPPLGAYTVSLLCVVCTERCVTQVPLCVVCTERCVTQVPLCVVCTERCVTQVPHDRLESLQQPFPAKDLPLSFARAHNTQSR